MRIDEAAELLDQKLPDIALMLDPDLCEAVNLGIEALRVIKTRRKCHITGKMGLLLGETE